LNFKLWFLAFIFSHFAFIASSANAIPTAEDINILAKRAKLTADTFMQESFELRMRYEYSGKFLQQDDKENLHKLAKRASKQLQAIAEKQSKLKKQIEDYEGDDWDDRYGSTGLWRKLFTDLYITNLGKCEIDFYFALTTELPERNEILRKILSEIDSLSRTYKQFGPILIKGRVLALLSQTETAYSSAAIKELEAFKVYSDVSRPIRAAIERIKLVGSAKPEELNALVRCLEQNRHYGDLELVLPLAFLQRQYDPAGFEKTIGLFPETQDFLGTVILLDISGRILQQKNLEQISVFEAELAVQTTWKNETKDYKMLLGWLSNTDKFQTPLILYVTAVAFADSSPTKAVNLLIKASRLQQLEKSEKLDIEPSKIAGQAAQLAYNLFIQDPGHCSFALRAFDNYSTITNEKMDTELQYIYSIILHRDGQAEKNKKILRKLAQKSSGYWSSRAKLDLIEQTIEQKQEESQSIPNELLIELNNFISECSEQDKESNRLRIEAITIYCQLLLESKEKGSSQKVLNILAEAETARDPNLDVFKSKALRQLGRLEESANCLLAAIELDRTDYVIEAMALLSEIIDKIDQLREQANDFSKLVSNCEKIAKYCETISMSTFGLVPVSQARLYLAEISIFAAVEDKDKLSAVEQILNSFSTSNKVDEVDLLRCQARLLTEQSKFDEAAELWTQVANILKNDVSSAYQRSWKWWRAKFYELDCWAKCPQTQKTSVLHTIEVLENSFHDIPPLWAEKLNSLKQQCRSRPR